jgi:hypothetical protein
LTRWQFECEQLNAAAELAGELENSLTEAELTIQQIAALTDRIVPFTNFIDVAVRFEAQELLAAFEALAERFELLLQKGAPEIRWRNATQIAEHLTARRA